MKQFLPDLLLELKLSFKLITFYHLPKYELLLQLKETLLSAKAIKLLLHLKKLHSALQIKMMFVKLMVTMLWMWIKMGRVESHPGLVNRDVKNTTETNLSLAKRGGMYGNTFSFVSKLRWYFPF